MGWIGTTGQLLHYLGVVGADRDDEGRFLVRGKIATFMGMGGDDAECVVAENAEYQAGGQWFSLPAGLATTSYGTKVKVI